MSPSFEVRVPAFNRPAMLRRALTSLIAQTYPAWTAHVYDDSSNDESRQVVEALADSRIHYVRNPINLGGCLNIDQSFTPASVSGGDYGCLLEDDNYWLPGFLSLLREHLDQKTWQIVMANQRINDEGSGLRNASDTTRGNWFAGGPVQPMELRGSLFLMEGVSNGGLVWKLDGTTDLRIGDGVTPGLQEHTRTLLITAPILFVAKPEAVWTHMPRGHTARAAESHRMLSRGTQSIRDYLLRVHGKEIVAAARVVARRVGMMDELERSLAHCGRLHFIARISSSLVISAAKGLTLRAIERDPSKHFLRSQAMRINGHGGAAN